MKFLSSLVLSLFLLVGFARERACASVLGLSVGALGGYSSLNANNEFGVDNGKLGFGLRVGLEFLSTLTVNVEGTYLNTTPTGTTTGFTSNFSIANVSVDYILLETLDKFRVFLGPKVGQGWTSAGGSSGTSFAIGGEAGVDVFTSQSFSIGGEVSYMSVPAPTVNGTTGNSGSLIEVLAAFKYWL